MPGAFKYRNFRLFFVGQSISLIGTWMQQVAMGWLVYRLTGSAQLLGLTGFCGQIPCFLLTPFAGVYTDRWNLHRTIVVTQTLAMIQAAVLAALVLTNTIAIWHIVAMSVFLGIVTAFDVPARQAFLIQMVEGREHLPSAISLNSSMFNGARVIGPAIAGFAIKAFGESVCFVLNAASYVAVLASLMAMHVKPREPSAPARHVLVELGEGFRYVFGFAPVREILLLLVIVNLASMPLTLVLLPVFAKIELNGDADTLGLLTASMGCGAFICAFSMAFRKSVRGLGKQIGWGAALFGFGLIVFSFSHLVWLSMLLLVVTGFSLMLETTASNMIVQTIVDDSKRGRVMSFYAMAFFGVGPFGSLLAGWLTKHLGAPRVTQIAGAMVVLASVWFVTRLPALRELIRPIYRRIGILPDISSGVPTVADVEGADIETEEEPTAG
jgi:MFS family permease